MIRALDHSALSAESKRWASALAIALAAHLLATAGVAGWQAHSMADEPDPVMVVELPPDLPPPPPVEQQPVVRQITPQTPQFIPQTLPHAEVPPTRLAPTPEAVAAQSQPKQQQQPTSQPASTPAQDPSSAQQPANPTDATGTSAKGTAGGDAKAKKEEANYYALIKAHLNRKKVYPPEAKKARQQGTVAVRFSVDRSGAVSNVSIKRSSGIDLLDQVTIALMGRVSPLPAFPASMAESRITLTLPIEYGLTTR